MQCRRLGQRCPARGALLLSLLARPVTHVQIRERRSSLARTRDRRCKWGWIEVGGRSQAKVAGAKRAGIRRTSHRRCRWPVPPRSSGSRNRLRSALQVAGACARWRLVWLAAWRLAWLAGWRLAGLLVAIVARAVGRTGGRLAAAKTGTDVKNVTLEHPVSAEVTFRLAASQNGALAIAACTNVTFCALRAAREGL